MCNDNENAGKKASAARASIKPQQSNDVVDLQLTMTNAGKQNRMQLQFSDVNYHLKDRGESKTKTLQILKEACGVFKSGRLSAILGPSGAGKTSMLNVLAGFKAKGVTGNFELNEQTRNLQEFRKMSSYIPQNFVMLDLLTVWETLKVSADLKLPRETAAMEKQKILENILDALNMQKCRNTLVRNLSGGELKRLSMGIELVTNPPIMFFDEPTSGLDSVASLQVINYLRRLACDGRIIVCVIHQPSSRLINLFDDVLVLSNGETLYSGPQNDMLAHFEKSGFICPHYYNPADFVLEICSEPQNAQILDLIERNKIQYSHKQTKNNSEIDEKTELLNSNEGHTTIELNVLKTVQRHITDDSNIRPKELVSFWTQFTVLMRRHMISMSRNMIAVQLRLIMHVFVGILLGVVYWNIGNDGAKTLSNCSCIFFIVIFLFLGNSMPSVLLCQQDPSVFIREYLNGWYSVNAYYLSRIVADLPMLFFCPTAFIGISYYMTGQPAELQRFLMCWMMAVMTTFLGHFLGMTSGSLFELQFSIFLVPSTTIPFLLFSGFFIRINELLWFLRPICDISFFRYILEGFLRAIYGYERDDLICTIDFCYFKSPTKFLKEMQMLGDFYSYDLLILCIFLAVLNILFYLSFYIQIRRAL